MECLSSRITYHSSSRLTGLAVALPLLGASKGTSELDTLHSGHPRGSAFEKIVKSPTSRLITHLAVSYSLRFPTQKQQIPLWSDNCPFNQGWFITAEVKP
jgi:hypothetical protein